MTIGRSVLLIISYKNSRVSFVVEIPGPIATAVFLFLIISNTLSMESVPRVSRAVSGRGCVMASVVFCSIIGLRLCGIPTVTSPVPDLCAPRAAKAAAPDFPGEPATTNR